MYFHFKGLNLCTCVNRLKTSIIPFTSSVAKETSVLFLIFDYRCGCVILLFSRLTLVPIYSSD